MKAKVDTLDDEPLGLENESKKDGEGGADADTDDNEAVDTGAANKGDELDVVVLDADEGAADADDGKGAADADDGKDAVDVDEGDTGDELTEEDKVGLTKGMQDRLRREKRVTKRRVEAAEARANEEVAARRGLEIENLGLRLSTAQMAGKTLKVEIAEAKAALFVVQEAGKTKEAIDAQEKLNLLQIQAREIEGMTTALEAKVELAKKAPASRAAANLRQITMDWMDRNKWFSDPKFSVAAAAAKAISTQLDLGEGISPDDPKHYLELDRRLHQEIPTLRQRLRIAAPRKENRPALGTTVASAKRPPERAASSNRVVLNKADLANMRSFGMDPGKQEDLQAYARSKRGEFNG